MTLSDYNQLLTEKLRLHFSCQTISFSIKMLMSHTHTFDGPTINQSCSTFQIRYLNNFDLTSVKILNNLRKKLHSPFSSLIRISVNLYRVILKVVQIF
jgi:hypothetical protein